MGEPQFAEPVYFLLRSFVGIFRRARAAAKEDIEAAQEAGRNGRKGKRSGRIHPCDTQGAGKNKTQRPVICCKFVGYLDIDPAQCHPKYTADICEGVAIEYVPCEPPVNLEELFPEGYGADDDSFEGAETEQA